jgi:hypothetical protein
MNVVFVRGGTKSEREIVEKAVAWCIKHMMPRMRTLSIDVKLAKIDAYGYCMEEEDNRTFSLEIRKGLSLYDLVSTVCHEMVHVKQYARKEMRFNSKIGAMMWKKSRVPEKTAYSDLPWEKEAFRVERELALLCFQDI